MRSKYGSILSNDPEHRHRARPQRDVCPKSILFCARPSYRSRASTGNNSLNPVTAGGHRFAAAVASDDDDDDDNSYRRIAQSTDDDVNIYIHLKLQLRLVRARRSIKLSPGEIDTANRHTRHTLRRCGPTTGGRITCGNYIENVRCDDRNGGTGRCVCWCGCRVFDMMLALDSS